MGCVDQTEDDDSYYIALSDGTAAEYFDEDSGYYVFQAGKVDWQAFQFGLYAPDGTLEESVAVTQGMISSDDLAKVESAGYYQITVNYQTLKLNIPIRILPTAITEYYTVTYHAGAGASFPDADPAEVVSGDDGPIWAISYADGYIDTTPIAEKPGYSFRGWRTENGAAVASGVTINSDRHYYAEWVDDISFNVRVYRYLDGRFVTAMGDYTVERNRQFELPMPTPADSENFADYTIIVPGAEQTSITEPGASITVTADTQIRVNYATKMFTVRFIVNAADSLVGTQTHPWTDEGATVIIDGAPVSVEYIKDVISYGGNSIDGYCITLELGYGVQMGTDTVYVPPVPDVDGATGIWRGEDGLNAVFGRVTSDLNYIASYTLTTFTVSFVAPPAGYLTPNEAISAGAELEPVKENNGSNVVIGGLHYGESVLANGGAFPGVPRREGYVGEWMFRTGNGNWASVYQDAENQILNAELGSITKDHVIAASYHASNYTVRVHDTYSDGEELIYTGQHLYNSAFDIPDEVMNELLAKYPAAEYIMSWRLNNVATGNVVSLPVTVTGNMDIYLNLVRQPYRIEFRAQSVVQFDPVVRYVTPDFDTGVAIVELPEISLIGYTISGWRYSDFTNENIVPYVQNTVYPAGSKVLYGGRVYETVGGADAGQTPGIGNTWREYTGYRKNILRATGTIEVSSSHTYSADLLQDTAFYVMVEPIRYTVNIGNEVVFEEQGAEATVTSFVTTVVSYNSVILPSGQDNKYLTNPAAPTYDDGSVGNFVFDGWYLDREYTTPVDVRTYVLNENTVPVNGLYLYPRWTDINLGTPGLIFEKIEGTNEYAVAGFDRSRYEEFSTLKMYIPDYHKDGEVTGAVTTVRKNAFADVSKMLTFTELHIAANLTTIEDNAFMGLTGISKVVVAEGSQNFKFANGMLTDVGGTKLYLYIGTASEVAVPDTVEYVVGGAFAGNTAVQRVTFGAQSELLEIGDMAFFGAKYLTEVALPASLRTIGKDAFKGAVAMRSLTVAENSALTNVAVGAFDDCLSALNAAANGFITLGNVLIKYTGSETEVVLTDSIAAIAGGAFDSQNGAEVVMLRVTADSSLAFIADGAFDGAISLTEVYMLTAAVPDAEQGAFDDIPIGAVLWVSSAPYGQFVADEVYVSGFGEKIKVVD